MTDKADLTLFKFKFPLPKNLELIADADFVPADDVPAVPTTEGEVQDREYLRFDIYACSSDEAISAFMGTSSMVFPLDSNTKSMLVMRPVLLPWFVVEEVPKETNFYGLGDNVVPFAPQPQRSSGDSN